MRKTLLLLTFCCLIQTSFSCTFFDHQFISMEDVGGGEFLFTFELCQGSSDGSASYTTGFLLDIPCLTITNVLTTTLTSTNGVEINAIYSGGEIEWGNINDQTLPHFIDTNVNGGAQQCFTVQFYATINPDCTDNSLIPYDFVAAWGPWSGSVYPENGEDHCWDSGNIVIPCAGEQLEVVINNYWPWDGDSTYLEVIDNLGNQIQYLDNSMLANFFSFPNTGPIPICVTCGTYTVNCVIDDNQVDSINIIVSNQNYSVESELGFNVSIDFETGISCCAMSVLESATDVLCPDICDGEIILTDSDAEGDVLYSIDGGETTTDNGTFSNLCPGTYEVMVSDSGGCLHTNTIVLTPFFPIVNIDNNDFTTECGEEEVTFINNTLNATSYFWDFGNGDSSTEENPTYNFLGPNSYEVILTAFNDQNCSVLSVDTFHIDINGELVDASFDINSPNCNLTHIDINNTSTGSVSSILWNMGNGEVFDQEISSYDYTTDGNFDITLNVANELCNDYDSFIVPASVFFTISEDIKIPNIITPNSDELNKNFELYFDDQINVLPVGTEITDHLDVYSMKVYNRWGNLKFDSNEQLTKEWNAEDCADGVYYYIIEYQRTCSDEVVQIKSGHVTVLR